jgi:2-polyprenyl-3-methyl-5-hydroxy-6-metoxy-1,4-benzoquinol methylase
MKTQDSAQPAVSIDEEVLQELVGKALVDLGATWNAGLIQIGDKLGLYTALAAADVPITSTELADRTGTTERYVREWLRAQAAGGYVTYHADGDAYSMTLEQAMLFADEDSPVFLVGGFQNSAASIHAVPQLIEAFRTGEGVGWHEHNHELFEGTERFFRPAYVHNLASVWIPLLDGVEEKLTAGARVADIACGHGASTIEMAKAFPNSTFVGYDYHEASIEAARGRAADAGVDDRVRFETATAKAFNGAGYDFITTFDAFHDLGDPAGAARHVRNMLAPGGTWMLVEPYASNEVEENFTPVGRAFYAASTMACVPCSLDQEVGTALGAQAGEARLREIIGESGFSTVRLATETPFNLILEARV